MSIAWTLDASVATPHPNTRAGSVEYAYTRALDPRTGNVTMRNATWRAGTPMAEVVLRALRTPLRSCAADHEFGLDYAVLDHLRPGADAAIEAAIRRCLRFLTAPGYIQRLVVDVDAGSFNGTAYARCDVAFFDPRSRQNARIRGA